MDEATSKKLRGRTRFALTRRINALKDPSVLERNDLKNRIEKLESIYTDFNQTDAALDEGATVRNRIFRRQIFQTKARLQELLDKFVKEGNAIIPIYNQSIYTNSGKFKLPAINIKASNGEYKDWTSFKDLYISLVHKNETLSNRERFQYLKGLLTDQPATLIKHIPVSDCHYISCNEMRRG